MDNRIFKLLGSLPVDLVLKIKLDCFHITTRWVWYSYLIRYKGDTYQVNETPTSVSIIRSSDKQRWEIYGHN